MADLPLEIKQEPDIKLEPEDEVDTIEYEQPLNQLHETSAVKVEKIDPDDDVDASSTYINRLGELVQNKQSCSSHIGTHPNGTNESTKSHEGRVVASKKAQTLAKSNGKSIKKIEKTNIRRSTPLVQKKQRKCSDCDYVTTYPSILKIHMRKHSGERPFPCASCDKRFSQKQYLKNHMKVHVNKDSIHCPGCWQIFATKEEKLNHAAVCKWRCYECFLCRAYSTNIGTLKIHMRIHSGVRPFQCAQCSMKFMRKSNLKQHLRTKSHQPKFRCSVCARNFRKGSEKNAHEMNCNRRRYECYLCQSYITCYKNDLQYHVRMHHTGERPFKCDSCVKCYSKEFHLKRHIKRSHKE